jgi:preprotein translocase subunit SecF
MSQSTEEVPPVKAAKTAPTGLHGHIRTLYRGETTFGFIPKRRLWYTASGIILAVCILSMIFRGFNFGVEFAGGTQFQIDAKGTSLTTKTVEDAFSKAGEPVAGEVQEVGSGDTRQYVVKTESLTLTRENAINASVGKALGIDVSKFTDQTVSSSWGSEISKKALQGLIVFLVVVSIYIAIRFEPRMAAAAIIALLHDLVLTAGVYSIVGFEVNPSTVVGLLTILGFSLYDTVVIFDKVAENTRDLTAGSRNTFSEATNTAVNQTLMRSINTSLISLLPVAGLLFIGVGVLGVGTIKDLALVMFVGLATGAYSSLFLAAPIVTDLTERLPQYKALTKRVAAKRSSENAKLTSGELVNSGARVRNRTGGPAPAPRPGARPQKAVNPTPVVPDKPATNKPPGGKGKPTPKRKR